MRKINFVSYFNSVLPPPAMCVLRARTALSEKETKRHRVDRCAFFGLIAARTSVASCCEEISGASEGLLCSRAAQKLLSALCFPLINMIFPEPYWFIWMHFSSLSAVHPLIQVPNMLVGAPLGVDIMLVCNAEASPKAINYWQRENGKIDQSLLSAFRFPPPAAVHLLRPTLFSQQAKW